MSIVRKRIGNREYAYLNYRDGGRAVQKYLGVSESPAVYKITSALDETRSVPEKFKPFFWDTNIDKLDLGKYRTYIIGRLLETGGLDAFEWLQLAYPGYVITSVLFTDKRITEKSRNFWLLWLGLKDV